MPSTYRPVDARKFLRLEARLYRALAKAVRDNRMHGNKMVSVWVHGICKIRELCGHNRS